MIFLSDDAYSYIKRKYIKMCIIMFTEIACLYTISKKVKQQEYKIYTLTKKIEELNSKGD